MIAIYARVSTDEQAKKGYSLKDQIRECRKLAYDNDVIEYIDEGVSGEILERPALSELRAAVKKGLITKIICLDPDRLSRRLMNQLIISDELQKKAELIYVNGKYAQTAEGTLFYQLRGAISEFEKAKIIERTSRGRREKARQGKVVRNYLIYGYNYDRNTSKLIINEAEAEVVRTIFHLFTIQEESYQGIYGIANYLNEHHIKTKRGAALWHRQVVRQILMNKTYTGVLYQNVWNSEGTYMNRYREADEQIPLTRRPETEWIAVLCPKIIEEETFNLAQKLIGQSRRRWAGNMKKRYLLSGLVRCGICENSMTGRKLNNWGKSIFVYTDKKSTACSHNKGCGNKIKAELLDEIVLWALSIPSDKSSINSSLKNDSDNRCSSVIKNSNILNVNLSEYTKNVFNLKSENPESELVQLKLNIGESGGDSTPPDLDPTYRGGSLNKSDSTTFETKQTLIRRMVSEIRVYEDEIKIILLYDQFPESKFNSVYGS